MLNCNHILKPGHMGVRKICNSQKEVVIQARERKEKRAVVNVVNYGRRIIRKSGTCKEIFFKEG